MYHPEVMLTLTSAMLLGARWHLGGDRPYILMNGLVFTKEARRKLLLPPTMETQREGTPEPEASSFARHIQSASALADLLTSCP